jgi:hypothetical protein
MRAHTKRGPALAKQLFTISNMAEIFAQADNLDEEGTERLHQRLRGARQRGILNPVDLNGPRNAARFDSVGLAHARLVNELMEMNVEITTDILDALNPHVLGRALTDLRLNGTPWELRLWRLFDRKAGRKQFKAKLAPLADFEESTISDRIVKSYLGEQDKWETARIMLPASLLIASIFERIEN